MISERRGAVRAVEVIIALALGMLVGVLIVWTFKGQKAGTRVSAVPLSAPETRPAVAVIDRDLEIRVIDAASKQPIAGALLTINMDGSQVRTDRTEAQGRGWVILPAKDPRYLSIAVKMDGYVGKRINYDSGEAIPPTHTVALERGIPIGGFIKDEEGNAVAGASVSLQMSDGRATPHEQIDQYNITAKSDQQGKWRYEAATADLSRLMLRPSHADFISDEIYGLDTTPRPPAEELKALSSVMVLKRGIAVIGKVMDATGKPIAGASVAQGEDRAGGNLPRTRTDASGKFRFSNARPGRMTLTVSARDRAPEVMGISVAKGMSEIEVRLGPGKLVKGKVVDQDGQPVGGALVAADSWRGNRSLGWRVETKEDGTFVWNGAPADEVLVDLVKPGYQYLHDFRLVASDKEVLITLRRTPKVFGKVVDGESGNPIEKFRVTTGTKFQEGQPIFWDDRTAKLGSSGEYEITFEQVQPMRSIKIEAAGYIPEMSRIIKGDEGDVQFDVKLKKGTGPSGVVKLADGTPAEGAEVVLCTPSSHSWLHNGKIDAQMQDSGRVVKTGADGKFEFSPQVETFLLVAVHDAGYAEVSEKDFKGSSDIKLVPWGKLEGNLIIASKPAAGQTISVSHNRPSDEKAPRFVMQDETATDKDGKFTFARVIPGEVQVSRWVMTRTGGRVSSNEFTHTANAMVKAGETAKVTVGGLGRPVVGRVKLPKDVPAKGWSFAHAQMSTKQPEPKYPAGWEDMSEEQQREWWKKLSESADWQKQQKPMKRYDLAVDTDGKFRIEDVLPGEYGINILIAEADEVAGSVNKEITVGEISGGKTDEPLDVGLVEVSAIKRVKLGEVAPEIVGKTFEGKDFKLSDYRGKYLLMEFWGSRVPPGEVERMKRVFELYGKDERLVIVGFNFDRKMEVAKKFADDNGVKWTQVFLGNKSTVPQEFGNQTWPSRWLIGPDGKVVARDIVGMRLRDEIEKALTK